MKLSVIYEDNHLLVVDKIPNVLSQADNTKDIDMLTLCKQYLKEKYNKPGNVFVGLLHRLDRPVGGVMVFAKTSKCASRISEQIRSGKMKKTYKAILLGKPEKHGDFVDYLYKNKKTNLVKVVDKNNKEAKMASLSYSLLETCFSKKENQEYSMVEIDLQTGRPHQIRVQFSDRGFPLYGDQRYSKVSKVGQQIALWSSKIEIFHPVTKEEMTFVSNPPKEYPWNIFSHRIE